MRCSVSPILVLAGILSGGLVAGAESTNLIQLPDPQIEGGGSLMTALKERRSIRDFSDRGLSRQMLSDLLWAAWGINRPDGRRTAPSALNKQEIDVYVVLPEGAFQYDPARNILSRVTDRDLRQEAGTQEYVKNAPVNLVYVADTSKMGGDNSTQVLYYGVSTGAIAQNVYLFCASEGLATVLRASVDRGSLAASLLLRPHQKITLAQSVGFPD